MRAETVLLLGAWLWLAAWPALAQEEYFELRGAVHIHTDFSTGKESLGQIAKLAIEHGVDVLVVTDDDILEVGYGLPFLRNLGYTRTENSPLVEGTLSEYFAQIERIDEKYPELILLGGVESNPFYYWEVDLGQRTWTMHTYDKHIIALGMEGEEAYARLPVLHGEGNERWDWTSLLLLWPLVGLVYALWLGRFHPRGLRLGVLVSSLLCLANNFPFKATLMDPYNGDLGPGPYQHYIDYVNARGGMVFWPHLEAKSGIPPMEFLGGLFKFVSSTPAHPEDLVDTYDYTGFAALYADNITATEPGRQWDTVLQEYLAGQRSRPVWGTGEIDYHYDQKGNQIHDILTVFLVKEQSREAVLEALRQGRMYAVRGGDEQLALNRFAVETEIRSGMAGDELPSQGQARISIQIDKLNGAQEEVKLRLIRSGQVIAQLTGATPLEFQHVDTGIQAGQKVYYRLMAQSRTARLTSNPIFVTGVGGAP